MSRIQVISVDLGDPIEQIISDDIRRLSEETIANIQTAADQKTKGPMRNDPETLATKAAYDLLFAAIPSKDSVEIDKLLEAASPAVTNPSSLMVRMKTLLRKMGNEYILRKRMRAGKAVYRLVPYNLEEVDTSQDIIEP
jgi:hypothetical protein